MGDLNEQQKSNWRGAQDALTKNDDFLKRAFDWVMGVVTAPGNKIVDLINNAPPKPYDVPEGPGVAWDDQSKDERYDTINPFYEAPPEGMPQSEPLGVVSPGIRPTEQPPGPSPLVTTNTLGNPEGGLATRTRRDGYVVEEADLQAGLVAKGYDIEVDGMAGPQTIKALNEFLADVGDGRMFKVGDVIPPDVVEMLR